MNFKVEFTVYISNFWYLFPRQLQAQTIEQKEFRPRSKADIFVLEKQGGHCFLPGSDCLVSSENIVEYQWDSGPEQLP